MIRERFQKLLVWVGKHERYLGALLFIFGFVTDLATFVLLDISLVNLLFAAYLVLAALCTLGSHYLYSTTLETEPMWRRTGIVLLPLGAQYAIGSLLSGFLIFYTKSSVIGVSWPFLILLAVVFLGNEVFRTYRDRLIFQTVLLFFTLYAYAIFALPLFVHTLGPWVFVGSSAASILLFGAFLFILERIGHERFREGFIRIGISSGAIVVLMAVSYFTSILPPIPLTMPEAGIYHSLTHSGDSYIGLAEAPKPWYRYFSPPRVHIAPGESLFAYTSVFAPIRFSAGVVHRWERYDATTHKWLTVSVVAFPIQGGRQGGYRGYSELSRLQSGQWRVAVETPEGQVIGRIRFSVVGVDTPPALHAETH